VPLNDLEAVRKYQPDPELALILALNTWVTSVLSNEWFHADVHAGNLLVLTDGRVAFIDFGIVGSIPRKTADAMLAFVRSYAINDVSGLGKALEDMGFTKELSAAESASFAKDLAEVLDSLNDVAATGLVGGGTVDETQLNRAVAAVGKIAEGYGIRFPREFALLIKQVLYFDRYTQMLAPGLDVLNDDRIAMNVALASPPAVPVEVEVLPPE